MKKYLLIVCMMLISSVTFAQQGSTFVGANVSYGLHKDYKNFGVGAKVQYEFIDNWRGEASGNYYFKKDNCTMWDVNLNVHYLFHISDKFTVYPLAGLTLVGEKVEFPEINYYGVDMTIRSAGGSVSDSDFGFNVGGGIEFPITDAIKINFEAKYQYVKDFDRPVLTAGIAFAL